MATLATACESEVRLWSVGGERKEPVGGLRMPVGSAGSPVASMLWCKGGTQPLVVATEVGGVGVYSPSGVRDESFFSVSCFGSCLLVAAVDDKDIRDPEGGDLGPTGHCPLLQGIGSRSAGGR